MRTYKIAIKFKDGTYWSYEELGQEITSEQLKLFLDENERMGKPELTSMLTREKKLYSEVEKIELIF